MRRQLAHIFYFNGIASYHRWMVTFNGFSHYQPAGCIRLRLWGELLGLKGMAEKVDTGFPFDIPTAR